MASKVFKGYCPVMQDIAKIRIEFTEVSILGKEECEYKGNSCICLDNEDDCPLSECPIFSDNRFNYPK